MQITNHDIIKSGEQELIDAITADLDWGIIEDIFGQAHQLRIEDNVEYKNGDIVVYNGQVAYQLDFDVNIVLSVLLDREGNYLAVTSSADLNNGGDGGAKPPEEPQDIRSTMSTSGPSDSIADDDEVVSPSDGNDAQEIISQAVSQAGEIMAEIEADE